MIEDNEINLTSPSRAQAASIEPNMHGPPGTAQLSAEEVVFDRSFYDSDLTSSVSPRPSIATRTRQASSDMDIDRGASLSAGRKRTSGRLAPINVDEEEKPSGSSHRRKSPPNLPRSAYILFLKSVRDKHLAAVKQRQERMMNMDALLKNVERQWVELTPEERKIFEDQAQEDNDRYQREQREYDAAQQMETASPSKTKKKGRRGGAPSEEFATANNQQEQHPNDSVGLVGQIAPPYHYQGDHDWDHDGVAAPWFSGDNAHMFGASRTSYTNPQNAFGKPILSLPSVPFRPPDGREAMMPLHPGMEILLSHGPGPQLQRYRVGYTCVSMTREQAENFYLRHQRASADNTSRARFDAFSQESKYMH